MSDSMPCVVERADEDAAEPGPARDGETPRPGTAGPTVFLAVRGGFNPRFLLRTDIVPTLRRLGVNVVVFSPNSDEPYFVREFQREGVRLERMRVEACEQYWRRSRLQNYLGWLRSQILSDRGDLRAVRDLEAVLRAEGDGRGLRVAVQLQISRVIIAVARRSRWVRATFTKLESWWFAPTFHRDLYERYRPQALVVTSLGYAGFGIDPYLMREARRFGCKVIGVVLSWDNTTTHGLRGGPVDHVIAWTDTMRRELIDCHDLPADRISVCGPPHFDIYYRSSRMARGELFRQMGLDPSRRLLVLGTKSPSNYPWAEDLVQMIAQAIEAGRLAADCQLVVRLHPIYLRRREGALIHAESLASMDELARRYDHIHINRPEIISTRLPLDMPRREMDLLAAVLRHASVLINIYSTLNIEGAITDTPTVNVSFNGYGTRKPHPRQDVAIDEAQPHNQRIVRSGGVAMVRSEAQLIDAINAYLTDPSLHAEGRARIRRDEGGPNPGTAGRAVGETLARLVGAA